MTPESGSFLYDGNEKHVSGFVSNYTVIEGNRYEVSGSAALISILLAAVSVIAFILTEDMTNTMAYIDKYTILMAVLLIGGIISSFFRKKKDNDKSQP